jgi:hypothetical protein
VSEVKDFCSVKNSPSDVESRLPILSIACPGGVRFMSWRGSSSVSTASTNQAASEMFSTHGQGVLQSDGRTDGNFVGDDTRIVPDSHSVVSNQSAFVHSAKDDICRNRY